MGNLTGFIEATTGIKSYEGKLNIGFMIGKTWYNIYGTQAELDEVGKHIVQKGNQIAFDFNDGQVSNVTFIQSGVPKSSDKWEDDMVTFESLLKAAHDKKEKFSIKTEIITIDLEKKYALFKAQVLITNGSVINNSDYIRIFEGHGDATDENVTGSFIKPHFIRMAETRAIVRALRWYTNNAEAAVEEKDGT